MRFQDFGATKSTDRPQYSNLEATFISSLIQSRFRPQPHKRARAALYIVWYPSPHVNGQVNEEVDARVKMEVEVDVDMDMDVEAHA
ncbi:hypothetical protein CGRA01v4_12587 [Colletotrichum graminicola]|nr:hypothetical protein CGRA01v4_12587 [Colletotrichum graminicola]